MSRLFFAEFAELIEFDLAFNEFFIFPAIVIDAFAFLTGQFDQLVL